MTVTAADDATVQKALDALAEGGFHGDTGKDNLKMKDDSGVTKGKVATITLTGIHNCCPACTGAIKKTVGKVEGVKASDVKPRDVTITVTGDFDAADLVKELNAAGFHVKSTK